MKKSDSTDHYGLLAFYWHSLLRRHASSVCLIAGLMLLSSFLEVATISLAVPLLDTVTRNSQTPSWLFAQITAVASWAGASAQNNTIAFAVLGAASVLYVVRSGFLVLHQYITARIGHRLRSETKRDLLHHFTRMPVEDLNRLGRGPILRTLETPPNSMYAAMIYLGTLFSSIFNAAMLLGLMLWLSWWATLAVGLLGFSIVYGSRRFMDHRAAQAGRAIRDLQSEQSRVAIDAIDGVRVVKAHAVESQIDERMTVLLDRQKPFELWLALLRNLPGLINESVAGIVVMGLALLVFLTPAAGMTFSTLVAFLVAVRQASPAVSGINTALVQLSGLRADIASAEEVLRTLPVEASGTQVLPAVNRVSLNHVWFSYPSRRGEWALQDIQLEFKKGTVTAIVGATGSGKSTIASLLLGFYSPVKGDVRVGDTALREVRLQDWRARVGYVSQDVFLFSDSVRNNIALWDDSISEAAVRKAATLAQLDDFVMGLPDGYETCVGDRGVQLSGGQCQRVALARALLRQPEVLILDEATSALDNLTERAIYDAIGAMRKSAAVVVIAHRLSTVRDADRIVVLEDGCMVEQGTHAELLARKGLYARLAETDSPEVEVAPS